MKLCCDSIPFITRDYKTSVYGIALSLSKSRLQLDYAFFVRGSSTVIVQPQPPHKQDIDSPPATAQGSYRLSGTAPTMRLRQ
jgi:hypothetical protein